MSKEKFAAFAEKYMDTIYRVAYSWTKNPDDANDVSRGGGGVAYENGTERPLTEEELLEEMTMPEEFN